MFKVSHEFGEIIGDWCGRGEPAVLGRDVPAVDDVALVASQRCLALGLDIRQSSGTGARYRDIDGVRLERHAVYGLCDFASVFEATIALMHYIKDRHGAGRVWFVAPPSYLNKRDEAVEGCTATRIQDIYNTDMDPPSFTPTGDGTRRVVIGAYYFHAAAAKQADPLDVEYDGASLRMLLSVDEAQRRYEGRPANAGTLTPYQRSIVSAHWSAELRCKLAVSEHNEAQRERNRITCDPREPLDLE